MLYIAHRGNIQGPEPEKENRLDHLENALEAGFHVEMDVVLSEDGWLYTGHDEPQEFVPLEFLLNDRIWVHAKTLKTLGLLRAYKGINVFFHDSDPATLTSDGWIWVHADHPYSNENAVQVILGPPIPLEPCPWLKTQGGICTDYTRLWKEAAELILGDGND